MSNSMLSDTLIMSAQIDTQQPSAQRGTGSKIQQQFRKIRITRQIVAQVKQIRDLLHFALEQSDSEYAHSHQNLFPPIFRLLDLLQQFLSPDGKAPEISDYEEKSPDQVNLSLSQLLVVFRRTLKTLHEEARPAIQYEALEILHSYLIELQGLYDLVFVRRFMKDSPELPFSLSALEDQHKRYFRCFKLTEQALAKLQQDGLPDEALRKLRSLKPNRTMTEERLSKTLAEMFGDTCDEQYRFLIMKHTQVLQHITDNPLIREYQSIQFFDLMNLSALHHIRAAFLRLLPKFIGAVLQETIQGIPRCRGIQDPDNITTVEELQQFFRQHPLTETAKLGIAFHRHIMRIADILGARIVLKWGRPVFELLILGTWLQTVKDHIVPGTHRPSWQAEHLKLSQDAQQEVLDSDARPGSIRLSSAFFMQPRVKFGLERFLIFKLRTITVGDIARVTEFGNWMRKNSPDEFLQFFNIALGDMGGLGIRTMPEHEIIEASFELTKQSLENLRKEGIPENILTSLKPLENQGITSEKEFLKLIETQIGDEETVRYKKPILKHAIDEHTLWLYSALMTCIPGGATSPGTIEMRKQNYTLTKKQQLFHDLRFYDPRFTRSSSLINDIGVILGSLSVLNRGRVGKALQNTESFNGKKRGF